MQMTWQKKRLAGARRDSFEALEFSDKVLDEELEVGGWKRNMDKREVVPTMKGRRPGFVLTKKERGIGGCKTFGRTIYVEWQQSGGTALS